MGKLTPSKEEYTKARRHFGVTHDTHVTAKAEQQAKKTGKLAATVDPSVDVIRRSLMRMDPSPSGGWIVTVGIPMPLESTTDTTGSMGSNVDVSMKNLPDTYALAKEMLPPGYDLQVALGIFGDETDDFILQRPQFEMTDMAIVEYLKDMVPERAGGDSPEDPQYGLFAAAYLTDAYINRIGLRGYHFCVSDATAHDRFSMRNLRRVFGDDVLEHVNANFAKRGEDRSFTESDIERLMIRQVVQDLLKLSHAFFLQVEDSYRTTSFWKEIYGSERVIQISTTRIVPQVQAAIIGLTEGTLSINKTVKWLTDHGVDTTEAHSLSDQLSRIPLGLQSILRSKLEHELPKVGDIFREKTDLWPIKGDAMTTTNQNGVEWL